MKIVNRFVSVAPIDIEALKYFSYVDVGENMTSTDDLVDAEYVEVVLTQTQQ